MSIKVTLETSRGETSGKTTSPPRAGGRAGILRVSGTHWAGFRRSEDVGEGGVTARWRFRFRCSGWLVALLRQRGW